jgi:hypothetical protein
MSTLSVGNDNPQANIELIDPLDQPAAYGGPELLTDLMNVSRVEGSGPVLDPALSRALRQGDYAEVEDLLPDVRKWFRDKDRYKVLDDGHEVVKVPTLAVAAPDVADVEVTASEELSSGVGRELSFKIAGNGLGASAKLTASSGQTLTCTRNESLIAYYLVPIRWELRSQPDNEDNNWVHTEIAGHLESCELVVEGWQAPGRATVLQQTLINNSAGSSKPLQVSKGLVIDVGADFTLGFKIDAIGLDASVKIVAEESFETKLTAALPKGHAYSVAWMSGPWGVVVGTTYGIRV